MIKRSLLLLVAVISVLSLNAQIINLNPDPDGAAWIAGDLPEITPEIQAELEFNPPQNLAVGQQYIYPDNYYYLSWDPPIANEDAGLVGYNVYANEEVIITTSSEVLSHTITADGCPLIGDESFIRFYVTALYENPSGESQPSNIVKCVMALPIGDNEVTGITILDGNYPNPFNPTTTISFDIAQGDAAVLEIFNTRGQKLVSREYKAGRHTHVWDADNQASGVYFYRLQSGGFVETKKMILMK